MANSWFRFKQFTIRQNRCGFKVGTDGVLLGAWADISGVRTILDIGTGTGLLALMLAQRSGARITAIEIDRPSYEEAGQNVAESPWSNRITVTHCSLQEFPADDKYDLVISNPPFFKDSLRPVSESLSISKHDVLLSVDDLAVLVPLLMHKNSMFCLILPVRESYEFEKLGKANGLFLHSVVEIKPTPGHSVKRRLMQFGLSSAFMVVTDELCIEKGDRHDYTQEYRELTRDFYLGF